MSSNGNTNSKRKPLLPLHIDTASFTTGQPTTNTYLWKRLVNKRHLPIILFIILSLSLFFNLVQHRRQQTPGYLINTQEFLPPLPLSSQQHAVIVAGHAIYIGPHDLDQLGIDANWILEPFQKGGQVKTFVDHIKRGIDILKKDDNAVLIFSGGETRASAGPRSESFSYWKIAQILIQDEPDHLNLRNRMITEEFAKDSHENLLFSICRFSEMTGNYPTKVTMIGFEFKRDRFEKIHRLAIGYPAKQFEYIGIDPPEGDPEGRKKGEYENSYHPFESDLYGCHGSLKQKKMNRNPFRRRHPYASSCPVLAPLFNYCPSDNTLYSGHLPWKV
ncbi:hypothetical protein RMATCC62417_06107 [Rhizopus microsporus]|nr:hypothetical protein RMATCC62417_06107 [Rhizopus microsporus]